MELNAGFGVRFRNKVDDNGRRLTGEVGDNAKAYVTNDKASRRPGTGESPVSRTSGRSYRLISRR
jgi:hypothetical protein